MLHVGVGTSTQRNPREAAEEATRAALAQAGIERPEFVLVFATVGYDQSAVVRTVREVTSGAKLAGCSAEGIIAQSIANESSHAVVVMVWSSDEARFQTLALSGLKDDPAGVGERLGRELSPLPHDALALFLFADGLTLDFDRFRQGLERANPKFRHLPLLGGAAGDNWQWKRTYQYSDDQVLGDAVSAALFSGRLRVSQAVNHGCVAVGHARTITRCEGNLIYEIDGTPVLDVLNEYLAPDEVGDFHKATISLCLGFEAPKEIASHYDELVIRALPAKDDARGCIVLNTEVTAGATVWMARRDVAKMTEGMERLAEKLARDLAGNRPKAVLHFDCAGRGKAVFRDHDKTRLVTRLQELVGKDAPWIGFYTFGEIGPVGTENCFHNLTAVVSAIY